MPRKDGIADDQNVNENDQNVINNGEDVREEANQNQDQNGDLDEYLNHLANYNPDDSYIDDEEFGYGTNDNANRTVVVDKGNAAHTDIVDQDVMPKKSAASKKVQQEEVERVNNRILQ